MTSLHIYYVDLNEYFIPKVRPSLRLWGPLSTSSMGAGCHLWPADCVSAKWTPPAALQSPLMDWDEVTSADGKGEEGGCPSFPETACGGSLVVTRASPQSLCWGTLQTVATRPLL